MLESKNGFVFPVVAGPVHEYVPPPTLEVCKRSVSPAQTTVSPVMFAGGIGFTVTVTGVIAGYWHPLAV
jgi:hypothetical protein